jgi:hypothetical protein
MKVSNPPRVSGDRDLITALKEIATAINVMVDFLGPGSELGDYADDAAAAAGGVPLYGLYRNGNAVQQRVA